MFDFINPWAYARKARDKRVKEQQRLDQIKRDALAQRLKNIADAEQKRRKDAYEQHLTLVRSKSSLTAKNAVSDDFAKADELRRRSREDDEERARRNRQQDDMLIYGPFSAGAPGHASSYAPSPTHCAPSDTSSSWSSGSDSSSSSDSSCSSSSDSGSSGGGSGD